MTKAEEEIFVGSPLGQHIVKTEIKKAHSEAQLLLKDATTVINTGYFYKFLDLATRRTDLAEDLSDEFLDEI